MDNEEILDEFIKQRFDTEKKIGLSQATLNELRAEEGCDGDEYPESLYRDECLK